MSLVKSIKFTGSNTQAVIDAMQELHKFSGELEVTIKPFKRKRSLSQNALYRQFMTEISEQVSFNDQKHAPEVWAEYFKKYFCPVKYIAMPAGDDAQVKSTTYLDKGEMCFYLNKIEMWAMDKNVYLTVPDNCEYRQLQEIQNN